MNSRRNSQSLNGLVVKSLGPQWSLGVRGEVGQSSFSNIDRAFIVSPGIEYDFFPYSESSRRSLVIQYSVGPARYDYNEITIYDKISETVPKHALAGSIGLRQPWGSLEIFSRFAQHLNDTNFYRATTFGSADVRLFKGFSFNIFAEYDKINDQIALAKGDVAPEESPAAAAAAPDRLQLLRQRRRQLQLRIDLQHDREPAIPDVQWNHRVLTYVARIGFQSAPRSAGRSPARPTSAPCRSHTPPDSRARSRSA